MAKQKISNAEIKQIYDQMDAVAQNEYYNGFLQNARQSFKKFAALIIWAGFLIVVALICLIPAGSNSPTGMQIPPEFRRYSPLSAILCLLLSVVCIFTAFSFKLKNKITVTVFFALNLIGIYIVGLSSNNVRAYDAIKEGAWVILFIFNFIAVILSLRNGKKYTDSVRSRRLYQGFAAVLVLNTALTYLYVRYIIARHINDGAMLPLISILLAVIGVFLYLRATFPFALTAFKAANTCKAIKGERQDGTKKIFWATLYPVINAYSTLFMFTFIAFMFAAIMSGVVSANNPRKTATVKVVYSDGRQQYYVDNETIFDEQHRQIGRVINGKVYDNNMNQTGYMSGDKIIPL